MVHLTTTASMVEAIETLGDVLLIGTTSGANGPSLKNTGVGKPISHGQVIDIWQKLRSAGKAGMTLEELLRGATIYVPPPTPKPEPTDEYKALMARLRREEEERSYERMLSKTRTRETFDERFPFASTTQAFAEVNKPSRASDVGGDDIEFGDVQKQVTLLLNFLISVTGCGAALFLASRWWSLPARLFLSLGGSIVVAIAEVAVYSAYTWRMAEGEKSEKKIKEVKEIVKTWVVGEEEDKKRVLEPVEVSHAASSDLGTNLRKRTKDAT